MPVDMPVEAFESTGDGKAALVIQCLGGFSVKIAGRPVPRWHAGKARSLFQYLLANRGHVVLRDALYEQLWPDQEWSPGSSSLKVAAHALRQILATSGAAARIDHEDFGYVLRAEDTWVDADQVRTLYATGRTAEVRGDAATAKACYRQVASLHRGDYLPGETADWVQEQRQWHRSLALWAIGYLRRDALARNDCQEAIRLCRQALAIDRYHEETYQALMIAHGRLGELDRVRSWHELFVRRLTEELDVRPTAETGRILTSAIQGRLRPGARPTDHAGARAGSPRVAERRAAPLPAPV
jgi:two-component SAPR family response regulator